MPKLIFLFASLLLCGIAPATAVDVPSRLMVSYNVIKSGLKAATITETFTRNKNGYRIESISKAEGIVALFKPETITVVSEGNVTKYGLRPLVFTNQRKLDGGRNSRADFDWANNSITLSDRDGKRTVPLPAGTQDRLSAMYQFMFTPLKNASKLDFHMTNGSKVDIYNYLVTPGQNVTVPLGTFKTLYVSNSPNKNESRTEIWLSAKHLNFPVKMVITDPDGDKFIQELTRFDLVP